MRIESIVIENYGPFFGVHQFAFTDRGLVLVMGDNQDEPRMNSNGAGKSSIFDALDWGLFGKVPRGDHADSICNEEARSCSVIVHLRNDAGEVATVTRERGKKNTLVFLENGVDRSALDMKETQQHIEKYLGLDRDVFHSAVLFGQTDLVHYAESTDAERMRILTRILQLDAIDWRLETAKAQNSKAVEEARQMEAAYDATKAQFDRAVAQDFSGKIHQWSAQNMGEQSRLAELCKQKTEAVQMQSVDQSKLPAWEARIGEIQKIMADIPVADVVPLRNAEGALSQAQISAMKSVDARDRLTQEIAQLTAAIAAGAPVCPQCSQPVSLAHVQEELNAVMITANAAEDAVAADVHTVAVCEQELAKANAAYNKAQGESQQLREGWMVERGKMEQFVKTTRDALGRLQADQAELAKLQAMYRAKVAEVNPYEVQRDENEVRVAALKKTMEEQAAEHLMWDNKREYLEFWVKALGPKGLKSFILDSRLQELTDAANKWVKILTGGTIWVQFTSQKETRGKKVVNSPDVKVFRWNPNGTITERNFRSWSGGEKQRISFAIDFGLSRLIASRATQRYDMLILDEVFKHLDQSGKEAVVEMLHELAREKSTVFVVEHDTEFQSSFEQRIVVQKKDRRSTILEERHERQIETTSIEAPRPVLPVGTVRKQRPIRTPV